MRHGSSRNSGGSSSRAFSSRFSRRGPEDAQLTLDRRNGLVFGVCAGLARWLDVDPMWVRIGAVTAAVFVTKVAVALYVIGWLVLDDRD